MKLVTYIRSTSENIEEQAFVVLVILKSSLSEKNALYSSVNIHIYGSSDVLTNKIKFIVRWPDPMRNIAIQNFSHEVMH